jgi:hypothetical protein
MSTPETDAAVENTTLHDRNHPRIDWVRADFARKLERERDEAREDAAHWKSEWEIVEARLCGWKHSRDNGIIFEHEIIPKLERERDEAREEVRLLKGILDVIKKEAQ